VQICYKNVRNNFRFRLEKCVEANGGTFEQELQECLKFHNDAHLVHGHARFNTFINIQRGNAASIRGTFPDSALLSEIFVL
jgi:hypothetical protein